MDSRRASLRLVESPSRLFFEVKRGADRHWMRLGDRWVNAGEAITVSVRRRPHRRGVWQVFAGGKPISGPIYLNHARRLRPAAAADALNGGTSSCNRFNFDFSSVETKRGAKSRWRPLKGGRVVQDRGYELIRISSAAFVARSSQAAGKVFVGDWETGDRCQWERLHYKTGGVASDQFAIVSDPVRQGAFAARFTVRPGDVFNSGGERCEVVDTRRERGRRLLVSVVDPVSDRWTAPNSSASSSSGIRASRFAANRLQRARRHSGRQLNTGVVDDSTRTRNELRHVPTPHEPVEGPVERLRRPRALVFHRRVSHRLAPRQSAADPYTKALELPTSRHCRRRTASTYGNYTKLGLYRWVDPVKTDVIYHDDFRRSSVSRRPRARRGPERDVPCVKAPLASSAGISPVLPRPPERS